MKVLFASLGCDKNLVDSEVMLGLLTESGYQLTNDEDDADIIVVNTCCFIHDAKEESVNTILEMAEYKKTGKCKILIVTGCMSERYKDEILDEIEEVDALLGTASYQDIVKVINEVQLGKRVTYFYENNQIPKVKSNRVITTGGYFSYIKIAEGCDKHCTYCIIPKIRGNYRSVPMEDIIAEANVLAQKGIKELILVAQETTIYGIDLYKKKSLHILLQELSKIEGIEWIRILYCYPEEIYDELIEVIKNEPKVCNYLDMPIQHASSEILKKMGRRTNKEELISIINKLRKEIPDIALRTTLITGFPGETEEQHEELLDFVDEMEFDRLGVFTYSKEEDTPAALLPDQIEQQLKESRRDEIMELQQEIVFDINEQMIGRTLDVIIEGKLPEDNIYIGRTYRDAPNVDGYIFVNSPEELISGDFVKAKITHAREYDLIGEIVYEFTE